MTPTDWTIRQAVRDIIAAADTTAVVLPKFILDVVTGENANLLRPTSGADSGKIHGWMIGRGKESSKRQGKAHWNDDQTATSYRLDSNLSYRIWFLHFYAHGDEGAGTDSAKLFADHLDDVIEAFALKPRLNITTGEAGEGSHIRLHHELQIESDPDIVAMGAEWAHFAPCRLELEVYRTPAD